MCVTCVVCVTCVDIAMCGTRVCVSVRRRHRRRRGRVAAPVPRSKPRRSGRWCRQAVVLNPTALPREGARRSFAYTWLISAVGGRLRRLRAVTRSLEEGSHIRTHE